MNPLQNFPVTSQLRVRRRIASGLLPLVLVSLACPHGCRAAEQEVLPLPTGPFKTGRANFHWLDAAREELETKEQGDKRELMVHLFYPAAADASGERAPYVPDAEAMSGLWNEEQMARIRSMRAFSIENAALPPGNARYPLAIFMPGGGMKGLIYHAFCEDLASHGWVVAAIDPPYNARAVRFPDGRVLGNLAEGDRGWPRAKDEAEEARFYRERIEHMARDASFAIDQLVELDRGTGPFAGRLDMERGVGVLGHSRGGQAAGAVRLLDERVRSGINLDGFVGNSPIQPIKGEGVTGSQPFLWILRAPRIPTDEQLASNGRTRAELDERLQQIVSDLDGKLETIADGAIRRVIDRPGVEHIDFSDEPFWDGSMTAESRPGKVETIQETREWVRAFLDATVRGEWAALKRLVESVPASPRLPPAVQVYGDLLP